MADLEPALGEGRGVITQDGCAVEVYRKLPYRGELELLTGHLPPQCSVLELGCAAGRLTQRLLDKGHTVTALLSEAGSNLSSDSDEIARCAIRGTLSRVVAESLYWGNMWLRHMALILEPHMEDKEPVQEDIVVELTEEQLGEVGGALGIIDWGT